MAERIPGSDLYVTHEKMNGYLTALLGGACAMVLAISGGTWLLYERITDGDAAITERVSALGADVAVIKVQVGNLHTAVPAQTHDISQAQYVLMQLPDGDAQLRDQRIRDIIAREQGEN